MTHVVSEHYASVYPLTIQTDMKGAEEVILPHKAMMATLDILKVKILVLSSHGQTTINPHATSLLHYEKFGKAFLM